MDALRNKQHKKRLFLKELWANGGFIEKAARVAGMTGQTARIYRDEDEEFAAAWERAVEHYVELLEAEADRRGQDGYLETTFGADGVVVRAVKRYSDNLLMFRLKALRPEKYRDVGNGKKPGTDLTEDELNQALERMIAKRKRKGDEDLITELTQ